MMKKPHALLVLLGLLFILTGTALAGDNPALPEGLYYAQSESEISRVYPQQAEGESNLFLPASADISALTLWFDQDAALLQYGDNTLAIQSGVPFDLTALIPEPPEDNTYPVLLSFETELSEEDDPDSEAPVYALTIRHSAHVASLFVTSSDPDKGRAWVDGSKDNKAKNGGIALLRPDGTPVYEGTLKNIKSRGNSTWYYPKKPYQIKLSEPVDLMETGDPTEAETTWVLLANYVDDSLIRNTISFHLAEELGLPYSPHCRPVDLYYDGEYRGAYLLSEKTEIGPGRVAINDLEAQIEDANPEVADFDALETAIGTNACGNEFQYVSGLAMPENTTGGYLLELDYQERALTEKCWFHTSHGYYVVVKSPEYVSREAMCYVSELYEHFEDAVFHNGTDPATGRPYTDFADLESLAKEYLILEFAHDTDAYLSSTYFYLPEDQDMLYAGPVWDFDAAYGTSTPDLPPEGLYAGRMRLAHELLYLPDFRKAVTDAYEVLYPQVNEILLSASVGAEGRRLRSILGYAWECSASRSMDAALWTETLKDSYASVISGLSDYIRARNQWLYPVLQTLSPGSAYLERFFDVPSSAWFFEDVEYTQKRDIFRGDDWNGLLFSPYKHMTRAMAVTILYRLSGEPESTAAVGFSDVADNEWYSEAVNWAAAHGIITGYPDGAFHPDDDLSRQDFAVLLHRYYGSPVSEADLSYQDAGDIEDYALPAMRWATEYGLFRGDDQNLVLPGYGINRCESAAVIARFCIAFQL